MKTKMLLFFLLTLSAGAAGQVTGRVVDAAGRAMPFVNVVMLRAVDSTAVTGVVTANDGRFTLPAPDERRIVRVASTGYATLYRPVTAGRTELGTLTLTETDRSLGEATVIAQRPVSKVTGDGLETSVEGTTLAKAGTATDVLERTPGMVKKADGLEVMGRGAPVFYINGRQVRNTNELDQLSSEDIKNIEVISNPGARYDASVGAVVRIRTVRRRGEGLSLDAMTKYQQGQYANGFGELNLNYRRNALDVFTSVNGSLSEWIWNSRLGGTTVADRVWFQNARQRMNMNSRGYEVTGGCNYALSEKHSLGLRYTMDRTCYDRERGTFTSHVEADDMFFDSLSSVFSSRGDVDPEHRLNAYYTGTVGRGELSVNVDYMASGKEDDQVTEENSLNEDNRRVHSLNSVSNRLWAGRVEYAFPWLGGQVTAGMHYSGTDRHDNYMIPQNDYNVSTSLTRLREQSVAGFVEYGRLVGRMQMKAGVRYERVGFDYYDNGVLQNERSRTYTNLFPSLALTGKVGRVQMMAAYTSKINRPRYGQLSNNVVYANRYLLQGGNPYLRPALTHNVSVTAVWNFLQAQAEYRHTTDKILFWGASLPEDPKVTKVTFVNKSMDAYQASLTASPVFGPWHPTLTAVVVGNLLKIETMSGPKRFDRPLVIVTWNNDVKLPGGVLFGANFNYMSRGNSENVYMAEDMFVLSTFLQKSFLNDCLSVKLGANDLLKEQSSVVRINFERGDFMQGGSGDSRQVYIVLRYKFNTARSKYRGRSAIDEQLKRL